MDEPQNRKEAAMAKVKITVIKKVNNKDLYGENPPAVFDENRITPECDRFDVGQEFVVVFKGLFKGQVCC